MIKISVFLEDKSGKVLGEAHSQKEKISIGAASDCSLKINDKKVAQIESEVYSVSGECWIQVGKEGAPITYNNKQYRTLKIEKNSELHFRNYKLKIMIESATAKQDVQPGFDLSSEPTKIMNESSKLVLDDATRILKKEDGSSAEATRVVQANEATRIVMNSEQERSTEINEQLGVANSNEATRIVLASEATRVVNLEKEETLSQFHFDENKTRIVTQNEMIKEKINRNEENDFFFNNDSPANQFKKINIPPDLVKYIDTHLKEIAFFAIAFLVCLYIGKTLFFSGKSPKNDLLQIADSQIQQLQKESIYKVSAGSDKLKHVEKTIQTVSREEYLRELSGLFDKN